MGLSSFFDPVLAPLLSLPPFWAILVISFLLALVTTFIYKYATDQARMKELKTKVKATNERMKKTKDDPKKLMKIQQEAMAMNLELMKHSFKPTLYTMLPILLIFWWMGATFAYHNLAPGEEFTLTATFAPGVERASLVVIPELELLSEQEQAVNGSVSWTLRGGLGEYKATVSVPNAGAEEKRFLIAEDRRYAPPVQQYKGVVKSITLSNEAVKPLGSLSLFGWRPGWLGTYILLSIAFSILLRKALGVV